MNCLGCEHFTARAASDATTEPVKQDLNAVGVCRRSPPVLVQRGDYIASLFPNVHRNHLCGEFCSMVPLC